MGATSKHAMPQRNYGHMHVPTTRKAASAGQQLASIQCVVHFFHCNGSKTASPSPFARPLDPFAGHHATYFASSNPFCRDDATYFAYFSKSFCLSARTDPLVEPAALQAGKSSSTNCLCVFLVAVAWFSVTAATNFFPPSGPLGMCWM